MLLTIFICLILLSIIRPKSKIVFYCLLILMWFIASFCTNCADRTVYIARYTNYSMFSSRTEIGFDLLMTFFNKMGISFNQYLMIIYAIIFGVYGWFIKRNTDRIAFVLGMYAIFSYCIDAIQIRNSIGFSFALIGINELFNSEMSKNKYIKFFAFVIIGSLFHFSNILFLLILLGNKLNIKNNIKVTVVVSTILLILNKTDIIRNIGAKVIGVRINEILGRVNDYTTQQINNMLLVMIISLLLMLCCLYLAYRNTNIGKSWSISDGIKKNSYIVKVLNSQIILFITIFMIPIIPDIYRIQRYGLILGYLGCSKFKVLECPKKVIDPNIYNWLFIITVLLLFYLQIYRLGNIESTFLALMNNNKFMH